MHWLSAGKPVTALAALQFVEQGKLGLDAPIADVLPEFAASGKERITLRDLLTHRAGLKPIATGWPHRSWQQIVSKICETGLRRDWEEFHNGYDPARTWFILGEMLQRIDGRPIEQILREQVLDPIGMVQTRVCMSPAEYESLREKIGFTYTCKEGELIPNPSYMIEWCEHPSPGGSMRGPIRELGLFYEMLLRGGVTSSGQRLLQPETVAAMTCRDREGVFDVTFQRVVDFGLGVIVNSRRYGEPVPYGFGKYASENSFGHGGSQSSIGFADPENGLVVAAVANGFPGDDAHNERFRALNNAIYEDLGMTD
jgi:CubicO group peptidase (beta-lactamase class C family)